MTELDFLAMLPMLITAYAGVLIMVVVAFVRGHAVPFLLTIIALVAALVCVFVALPHAPRTVAGLIRIDSFSLYFTALAIIAAILVALLSRDYLPAHERRAGPYYILLLFAVTGMTVVASSSHFVSFFLAYETLSASLFGLIGYTRRCKPSLEAAMKYLILAATSSAFMLFGIALIYAEYGSLDFSRLIGGLTSAPIPTTALLGLGLVLVGIGFKLAVVPFHMWSPDVYQGAPAPVTALIATGSKAAVFALLLRLVTISDLAANPTAYLTLAALATATMTVGNLLALLENNLKRLLAYSSIAQIGYLFIPLIAGGTNGASSIAFYFASYFATAIAAFGVVAIVSSHRPMGDVERLEDYRGLAMRHPALSAILAISMLSLMGLPLTSGFFGKFYIFLPAAQTGLWWLLIVGVVNSGISAFYYLRVVFALYSRPDTEPQPLPTAGVLSAVALAISTAAIVFFGIYPSPLLRLAQAAMGF